MVYLKYLNPTFALKAYKQYYALKDDKWEVQVPSYMEHFHKDYEAAEAVLQKRNQLVDEIEEILMYKTDKSTPRELDIEPFLYDSDIVRTCIVKTKIVCDKEDGFCLQGLSTYIVPGCGSDKFKDEEQWITIYPECIPTDTLLQIIEQIQLYENML